ncbi:MAG: heme biosynthesis protein HemY [Zoogloea sp.]|nr:heme biosynthesis protein HemY [Zoogloea sp.]
MRALFWLLGLFSLAVGLAIAARYNDGYALIVWSPYRLQISLNLLILLLVAGFALLYAATRLVANTLALPRAVTAFRARKRQERAAQSLRDAVRLRIEGRYGQAMRAAAAAYDAGESPGLSALLAARAAHSMRDQGRYREWLAKAAERDAEIRVTRLMTEAELAVEGRRFDEASECLAQLMAGGQRHIAALRLGLRTAQMQARWDEVLRLTRQLLKYRALTPEHAALLKRQAHVESLRECEGDPVALVRYWQSVPRDEQRDRKVVETVANLQLAVGDTTEAQHALENQLEREWDSGLAGLYGRCKGGEVRTRLAMAEGWLKRYPRDSQLLLTLGRLCVQAQLWGKAESYLDASRALHPGSAVLLELARLAEHNGNQEAAARYYREAAETQSRGVRK